MSKSCLFGDTRSTLKIILINQVELYFKIGNLYIYFDIKNKKNNFISIFYLNRIN